MKVTLFLLIVAVAGFLTVEAEDTSAVDVAPAVGGPAPPLPEAFSSDKRATDAKTGSSSEENGSNSGEHKKGNKGHGKGKGKQGGKTLSKEHGPHRENGQGKGQGNRGKGQAEKNKN